MRRAMWPWSNSPPCCKFHTLLGEIREGFRFPSLPCGVAEYQGINSVLRMRRVSSWDSEMFTPSLPVQSQSDNEQRLKLAGEIWCAQRGQHRRNTMFHKVTLKRQNTLIPPQVRWNEEDLLQVRRINNLEESQRCEIRETLRNGPRGDEPPEFPSDSAAPLAFLGFTAAHIWPFSRSELTHPLQEKRISRRLTLLRRSVSFFFAVSVRL